MVTSNEHGQYQYFRLSYLLQHLATKNLPTTRRTSYISQRRSIYLVQNCIYQIPFHFSGTLNSKIALKSCQSLTQPLKHPEQLQTSKLVVFMTPFICKDWLICANMCFSLAPNFFPMKVTRPFWGKEGEPPMHSPHQNIQIFISKCPANILQTP